MYCKKCDLCQPIGQPTEFARMPLQLVLPLEPIQKWGFDLLGPFSLVATRIGNKYILVATDYSTKWVEAKGLRYNMVASTTRFLYEQIWYCFGCPIKLISDQAKQFPQHNNSRAHRPLRRSSEKKHVVLSTSHWTPRINEQNAPQHPKENRQRQHQGLGH